MGKTKKQDMEAFPTSILYSAASKKGNQVLEEDAVLKSSKKQKLLDNNEPVRKKKHRQHEKDSEAEELILQKMLPAKNILPFEGARKKSKKRSRDQIQPPFKEKSKTASKDTSLPTIVKRKKKSVKRETSLEESDEDAQPIVKDLKVKSHPVNRNTIIQQKNSSVDGSSESEEVPAKKIDGITKNYEEHEKDEENYAEQKQKKAKSNKSGEKEQNAKPAQYSTACSKTVFVKHLTGRINEETVKDFFKDAGEVHEVRLAKNGQGQLRGFCHVEFTSAEAAIKACEMCGQVLEGREIFIDFAKERPLESKIQGEGSFGHQNVPLHSGPGIPKSESEATAFVKGFDKFKDEDSIRNSLSELFSECEVLSIRIPTDRETGHIKGFAYIDFENKQGLSKAVEFNGSDFNGRSLVVEATGASTVNGGGGRGRGEHGKSRDRGRGDFGSRGRGGRGRGGGGRGGGGRGGGGRGGGGRGFGKPKEKAFLPGTGF